MASEQWRLFIGLMLPQAHSDQLAELQGELSRQPLAVRWIRPENMHITLHFLGDVAADRVPELEQQLDRELAILAAPTLALNTLGAFPNLRKPGVVWAGVSGTVELATALHDAATTAGQAVGVPPEDRAYHPHITLGYVRRDASSGERSAVGNFLKGQAALETQAEPYTEVALIRSVLRREGATYTPLKTWSL